MKPLQNISRLLFLVLISSMILQACSKSSEPVSQGETPPDETLTFKSVIARGPDTFNEYPKSKTSDTISEGDSYADDYQQGTGTSAETVRYQCTPRVVNIEDGTGEFQTLNSGGTGVVYPGSLVQGKTINNVTPTAIPLKRGPGSISYDLNDGNIHASETVNEVSESSIRQAMNNIIASSSGIVPNQTLVTYEDVYSEKQVALYMRLSYEVYNKKAEGQLSFSSDKKYNRILYRVYQKYYTVSYDFPTYDEIFAESVTPKDLEQYIQSDNPAAYIKSVTYGRVFYMLYESTSSLDKMHAQIDASYEGITNKLEGSLDVSTINSLDNLNVKVIAYGGDSKQTFGNLGDITLDGLNNMISKSTDIRSALPLSYTINSLEFPEIELGTNLSTEFEVQDCELKGTLPPTLYNNLVDLFPDGVGAATAIDNEYAAIYNGAGTQYVLFNGITGEVTSPYDIHDAAGPLGATSFDNVGAAVRQFNTQIYVFNATGNKFEILRCPSVNTTSFPTSPVGSYDQEGGANKIYDVNTEFSSLLTPPVAIFYYNIYGNLVDINNIGKYPLYGNGIQCAVRRELKNQVLYQMGVITTSGYLTSSYYYSNASNGSSYSRLDYYNPSNGTSDFRIWTPETSTGYSNEAACKIDKQEGGSGKEFRLYFTTDGLIYIINADNSSEGPWAI